MKIFEDDYKDGGKIAIPVHSIQRVVLYRANDKWCVGIYTGNGLAAFNEFESKAEADEKYAYVVKSL